MSAGKGNRPITIDLPEQASDTARAMIPAEAIPEAAAAIRATYGRQDDSEADEDCVTNWMMDTLRETVQQHRHSERIRAAIEAAQQEDDEIEW